jgi:transcriptional regulator with XRE-family HTH domain
MTPDELRAWRQRLGLSQRQAAEALGVGHTMYGHYERGYRKDGPEGRRDVAIPRTVALACAAIAYGLPPFE